MSSDQHNQQQTSTSGRWDQTIGSAKESLGNLTGYESLRKTGQDQNAAGKEQEAQRHVDSWTDALGDRAKGAVGSLEASVKGNPEEEKKFADLRKSGRDKQHRTESEVERRAS